MRARAGGRDAEAVEFGDCVLHSIRSGVRDMIAGQRCHVESRALQCSEMRWIAGRCGNIEMRLDTPLRMRNFDVPYENVTCMELMACQVKQGVGVRLVENQVADHLQGQRFTHGNTSDSGDLYT
jgi:hypothetical protein